MDLFEHAIYKECGGTRNLSTRKRLAPECARKMIAILHVHGGWLTRKEIMARTGWKDDRLCRLGCETSHGRIIFSNISGYKLMKFCTLEEFGAYIGIINENRKRWDTKKIQAEQRYHSRNTMRKIN